MEILIGLLGIGSIYSGLMVISSINPVHSVFYLVLAFINTSLLLLIMGVEFLSILFIIVYVGAIAVLFLFVVMMLNIKLIELIDNTTRYVPIGFIIGIMFLTLLSNLLDFNTNAQLLTSKEVNNSFLNIQYSTNIELIGNILYTEYYLFFIIASFILLVSMIGAIILTINNTSNSMVKRQDLFSQIATEYNRTITSFNLIKG
jgi:NADH:ubiquinone oxidoreductase subunit 6 (subunit J)